MMNWAKHVLLVAGALGLAGCVSDEDPYDYNRPYQGSEERLHNSGYYDSEGVYHPSDFSVREQVLIREGQSGTYWYPDPDPYYYSTYPYYYGGGSLYRTDPYWDRNRRDRDDRRDFDRDPPRQNDGRVDDRQRDRDQRSNDRYAPENRERERDQRENTQPDRSNRNSDAGKINEPNKTHIPPRVNEPPPAPSSDRQRTRDRGDSARQSPVEKAPVEKAPAEKSPERKAPPPEAKREPPPKSADRGDSGARRAPPPSGNDRQRTR